MAPKFKNLPIAALPKEGFVGAWDGGSLRSRKSAAASNFWNAKRMCRSTALWQHSCTKLSIVSTTIALLSGFLRCNEVRGIAKSRKLMNVAIQHWNHSVAIACKTK